MEQPIPTVEPFADAEPAVRRARCRAVRAARRGLRQRAAPRLRHARQRGRGRGPRADFSRGRRLQAGWGNSSPAPGRRWKTRMFAPGGGIPEDPATGWPRARSRSTSPATAGSRSARRSRSRRASRSAGPRRCSRASTGAPTRSSASRSAGRRSSSRAASFGFRARPLRSPAARSEARARSGRRRARGRAGCGSRRPRRPGRRRRRRPPSPRQAAARLAPGTARVVGDDDRGLRVDDRDDRRARAGGGDQQRQRHRRRGRGLERRVRLQADHDLLLEVDEREPVGGQHVGDHAARPASRSATSAQARRPAATGGEPPLRAARYAVANESPAPVGSALGTACERTSSATPSE